uniref:C-type lectin domain-containing protein n=1 Tax=Cyclopterus lumpus TaxID=8103 RepID=A0A8C2WG06_CYCLU
IKIEISLITGPGARALLTFSLLLVAARCADAFTIHMTARCPAESKSWSEARLYCQKNHRDLATWDMVSGSEVAQTSVTYIYTGWIGLYRSAGDSWKWISGDTSDYRNWAPGEPITSDCGSFDLGSAQWNSKVCSEEQRFACYDDNVVVVAENKTWEGALSHCRSMQSRKSAIRNNKFLQTPLTLTARLVSSQVWTSLRFLGGEWWWADGQKLEDQGTLPDCPSPGEYCGVLSKNNTDNWITRDCAERRNFVCYKEKYFLMPEQPS